MRSGGSTDDPCYQSGSATPAGTPPLRNDVSLDVDMALLRTIAEGTAKIVVSNSTGQVCCVGGVLNWKRLCS
jgi:hypothetical protein